MKSYIAGIFSLQCVMNYITHFIIVSLISDFCKFDCLLLYSRYTFIFHSYFRCTFRLWTDTGSCSDIIKETDIQIKLVYNMKSGCGQYTAGFQYGGARTRKFKNAYKRIDNHHVMKRNITVICLSLIHISEPTRLG